VWALGDLIALMPKPASPVNLGAVLAYSLNASEATTLARALDTFAKRVPT
jgi:hypothetical protein